MHGFYRDAFAQTLFYVSDSHTCAFGPGLDRRVLQFCCPGLSSFLDTRWLWGPCIIPSTSYASYLLITKIISVWYPKCALQQGSKTLLLHDQSGDSRCHVTDFGSKGMDSSHSFPLLLELSQKKKGKIFFKFISVSPWIWFNQSVLPLRSKHGVICMRALLFLRTSTPNPHNLDYVSVHRKGESRLLISWLRQGNYPDSVDGPRVTLRVLTCWEESQQRMVRGRYGNRRIVRAV